MELINAAAIYTNLYLYSYIKKTSISIHSEPVGAKSPTLSSDIKWSGIERKFNQSLVMLCPAQGFPAPITRYITDLKIYL